MLLIRLRQTLLLSFMLTCIGLSLAQDSRPETAIIHADDSLFDAYSISGLTIYNDNPDKDAFVIINSSYSHWPVLTVYIRSGERINIGFETDPIRGGIRDGTYFISFKLGNDWNQEYSRFSKGEQYYVFDNFLNIDQKLWYIRLRGATEEIVNENDQSALESVSQGNGLMNSGKYDEALNAYSKAIELSPKGDIAALAWSSKGDIFRNLAQYDQAITAYNEALALNPIDFESWKGKGIALSALGEYEEAIQAYDNAIKLYPIILLNNEKNAADGKDTNLQEDLAKTWFAKGEALNASDRTTEAQASYSKARELGYID
jgi:tetratricopeptide (TPR) repeat protein